MNRLIKIYVSKIALLGYIFFISGCIPKLSPIDNNKPAKRLFKNKETKQTKTEDREDEEEDDDEKEKRTQNQFQAVRELEEKDQDNSPIQSHESSHKKNKSSKELVLREQPENKPNPEEVAQKEEEESKSENKVLLLDPSYIIYYCQSVHEVENLLQTKFAQDVFREVDDLPENTSITIGGETLEVYAGEVGEGSRSDILKQGKFNGKEVIIRPSNSLHELARQLYANQVLSKDPNHTIAPKVYAYFKVKNHASNAGPYVFVEEKCKDIPIDGEVLRTLASNLEVMQKAHFPIEDCTPNNIIGDKFIDLEITEETREEKKKRTRFYSRNDFSNSETVAFCRSILAKRYNDKITPFLASFNKKIGDLVPGNAFSAFFIDFKDNWLSSPYTKDGIRRTIQNREDKIKLFSSEYDRELTSESLAISIIRTSNLEQFLDLSFVVKYFKDPTIEECIEKEKQRKRDNNLVKHNAIGAEIFDITSNLIPQEEYLQSLGDQLSIKWKKERWVVLLNTFGGTADDKVLVRGAEGEYDNATTLMNALGGGRTTLFQLDS